MELKKVSSKSGNIVSAGYSDGKMQVQFKSGATYEYDDVGEDEWGKFAATFDDEENSTGSYFHRHLKGKKYKKLGDE
jgi:hypothetical protein